MQHVYRYDREWLVRPETNDVSIIIESFMHQMYNLKTLPKKPINTIVDIGGHIGSYSVHLAQTFPEATIYIYEPMAENYMMLLENIRGLRINPMNAAVYGAQKPSTTIHKYPLDRSGNPNTGASILQYDDKEGEFQTISIKQLQEDVGDIDLLKLDCEGGEYSILPEMDFSKVGYVMIEFHTDINGYKFPDDDFPNALSLFFKNNFKMVWYDFCVYGVPQAHFINEKYWETR